MQAQLVAARRSYHARIIDTKHRGYRRSLFKEGETWNYGGNRPYFFDPETCSGLHFDVEGNGSKGRVVALDRSLTTVGCSGPRSAKCPRQQRRWVLRNGDQIQKYDTPMNFKTRQLESIDQRIKLAVETYLVKQAMESDRGETSKSTSRTLLSLLHDRSHPLSMEDWGNIMQDESVSEQSLDYCQRRWNLVLDPRIKHDKWTKMEDKLLMSLAEQYKGLEWQEVAAKLAQATAANEGPCTHLRRRTPLQCIVRYQKSLNAKLVRHKWLPDEDERLKALVSEYGVSVCPNSMDWGSIASRMIDRTEEQCHLRYRNSVNPMIKRGRFNREEDMRLLCAAELYGIPQLLSAANCEKNGVDDARRFHISRPSSASSSRNSIKPFSGKLPWSQIAALVPGRTDLQCRERYMNSLWYERQYITRRAPWTTTEDYKLLDSVQEIGAGKWGEISKRMHLRTDHECRKRWEVIASDVNTEKYTESLIKKRLGLRQNFTNRKKCKPDLTPDDFVITKEPKQHIEDLSQSEQDFAI
jgi:hypothetical protein